MPLDHVADRRQQRGHIAPSHPLTAPGIEHRLQLVDHERHIAAAPEHRRDHARQRHRPGEVLDIFRVDENLERPHPALIVDDVVERDIQRMIAVRPAHLVGLARQFARPVERPRHVDDGTGIPLVLGQGLLGRRVERQFGFLGFFLFLLADFEHGAGNVVRTVRGAALAAQLVGLRIDVLEVIKRDVFGDVDGLGDRAVDVFLHRGLHHQMIFGRQRLCIDEGVRQRRVRPLEAAIKTERIIGDFLLAPGAVGHQDMTAVFETEHRLQARRNVVGEQRNRAGRRDRRQQCVADTVFGDSRLHVLIHLADGFAGQVLVPVEQRKRTLFAGQVDGRQIRRALHRFQPFFRQLHRFA